MLISGTRCRPRTPLVGTKKPWDWRAFMGHILKKHQSGSGCWPPFEWAGKRRGVGCEQRDRYYHCVTENCLVYLPPPPGNIGQLQINVSHLCECSASCPVTPAQAATWVQAQMAWNPQPGQRIKQITSYVSMTPRLAQNLVW